MAIHSRKKPCEEIFDSIKALLAEGTVPWVQPWVVNSCGIVSHCKGRPYGYRNRMLLRYGGEYATFHQVKIEGGTVNKGAHGQSVWFSSDIEKKDADGEVVGTYWLLRRYVVFNVKDTSLKPKYENLWGGTPPPQGKPLDVLLAYLQREGIEYNDGGSEAFYSPADDKMQVPSFGNFGGNEARYWSTVFHEVAHSTGAERRLDRVKGKTFGDSNYAREELVAEMTAALCLGRLGFDSRDAITQSAGYIASWQKRITQVRPDEFGAVCMEAEEACNYIFGK